MDNKFTRFRNNMKSFLAHVGIAIILAFLITGVCEAIDGVVDIPEETYVETVAATEAATEPEPVETEPAPTEPTEPTMASEPICEAVEAPVSEETKPLIDQEDLELLACVIYQEAGSDSICDACRRRVADVVLNRVADSRFPDTIHGVLTQKGQYGRYSSTGVVWPKRAKNAGERHAVKRAYRIAEEVLWGQHSELYGKGYIWQAGFKQGRDNIYCCGHYYGRS